MEVTLQERLKYCTPLPSPPVLASRLLELCEQPNLELEELCDLLMHDPALSARLLRAANSPVYGYRRRATTRKDALLFLGVNGAVSLALTFTLTLPLQRASLLSVSYERLWHRSALAALVAAETAKPLELRDLEEVFLITLLQDIGIFALLQLEPEAYSKLLNETDRHADLPALEKERFGGTHAEVGAWLLRQWRVPVQIADLVAASHEPLAADGTMPLDTGCVALLWQVAEYMMQPECGDELCGEVRDRVDALFGGCSEALPIILESVQERVPQLNQLFESNLLDMVMRESMLERAHELLLIRNLQIISGTEDLKERCRHLEARARTLQEQTKWDHLTGLHSRTALDEMLEQSFQQALKSHEQLSLLMIDLDRFKDLNDRHGHIAGDDALRDAGRIIGRCIRDTDFAARYGGDEFVILLAKTNADIARRVAERIRGAFLENTIDSVNGRQMRITVSIGMATLDPVAPCD